ncbi:bifunctional sugar-1-phosphate nucleotidylyltransferase/acetyltransferase [Nanoarchaeota archaeon]
MQAVILAAGKSTRTQPLTVTRPKSLLKVLDKTIIEHTLEALDGIVDEVIIIVGFKKEMIMDRLGSSYKSMRLFYAEQKEQLGTGHALMSAKQHLKDRFLVINGDDIYSKEDIEALSKHDYAVLLAKVKDWERFGIAVVEDRKVKSFVEKPKEFVSDLANTGAYVFRKDIFDIELNKTERGEYEVTDYIIALAKKGLAEYETIQGKWIPIGYPWNYLEANVALLREIKESRIDPTAKVEDNVIIKGTVVIGKNTIIKPGTYIEGPVFIGDDCIVGPQAYVRKDTIIMDKVNTRAEMYDVVMMDGTTSKHNSYLSHSVIGENCNIGCGTVTADYRHDAGENWTIINGKKINSGRRKLGAFLGDRVHTGIGTLIYPGRKIWPYCTTIPGEVVTKDITESEVKTTDKR